jgi:hypothetical protein
VSRRDRFLDALIWAAIWLVFFALLVPVGFAGWVVGH